MGYHEELRKQMGPAPLIMPGANVILLNDKNEILMHHRRDKDWWGLPGGMMELGESFEETAKREVFEEVNLQIEDLTLFQVYSGKELFYQYPDGNQVYNVTVTYVSKTYSGDLVVDQIEGRDAKFLPLDQLPLNISVTIQPILNDFLERRNEFLEESCD